MDGVTAIANDANHSVNMTYNNSSQSCTDEEISTLGMQINQTVTKFKISANGTAIIYTKQQ